MTTVTASENAVRSSSRQPDDLTVIKGIGSARQQWLQDTFGIHTYEDLAVLSPDEVLSRLKEDGKVVSSTEIEGWLEQAKVLGSVPDPAAGLADQETEAPLSPASSQDGWKPFASFVVEFQIREVKGQFSEQRTTVHYMELDKTETWTDIESAQLCQWMVEQASDRMPEGQPLKTPSDKSRPLSAPLVTVQSAQVRIFQPADAETPVAVGGTDRPFLGFVSGDQSLSIETSFELVGPDAGQIAEERRTYSIQFYAHELPTGATLYLGDTETYTLAGRTKSDAVMLPQVALKRGIYRLSTLTTLDGSPPIVGYAEVPLLQVV